jgi:hypothetical protein
MFSDGRNRARDLAIDCLSETGSTFKPARGIVCEGVDSCSRNRKNGLLVVEGADAASTSSRSMATAPTSDREERLQAARLGLVDLRKLATLFDPPEKRGNPGPLREYAVELPK